MPGLRWIFVRRLSVAICLAGACLGFTPPILHADVTVEFILDGSGSMWTQLYDQYKIVILRKGVEDFLESGSQDLRLGVRAFGLTGGEGCSNTQLLVKPALNAQQDVRSALKKINPTGQAPIIFSLRKGLKDLEGIDGKKILILIADGSDTCDKDFAGAIEKLSQAMGDEEIHVIGLGIREEKESSELKLLAAKSNGAYYNVANSSQLAERIRKIADAAVKAEERRLRHLAEEKARLTELADKTRLVVEFISDVSDFFCTGIEVVDLQIDGTSIASVEQRALSCEDQIKIFDSPVPKGDHRVSLTYSKTNHGDVSRSRPETFTVKVEPGKTTRLRCRTVGHLFYWGLESDSEVESAP